MFPRPCQPHVKQPHLLCSHVPFNVILGQQIPQRRIKNPPFGIYALHPQIPLAIENNLALGVTENEPLAEPRQNHHRKLQPFALVYAHYPHHVFRFAQSGGYP